MNTTSIKHLGRNAARLLLVLLLCNESSSLSDLSALIAEAGLTPSQYRRALLQLDTLGLVRLDRERGQLVILDTARCTTPGQHAQEGFPFITYASHHQRRNIDGNTSHGSSHLL